MQAPEILGPPLTKVIRKETLDLPHQSSTCDSNGSTRLHKPRQVVQVQIIRPKIREGVDTDNGVEEVRGEWERPGVDVKRKHAILDPCIPDALHVLRRAEPKVGSPNLHSEFSPQKD